MVLRAITGFHRDEQGDWVAALDCGHGQHARHSPPFTERPWVTTAEGREGRLGTTLDCPRCDRREMPEGHAPYRSTPTFDEASVPKALLRAHDTKAGVWAHIRVERGELEYTIHWPGGRDERDVIGAGAPGIVVPEIPHAVRPLGPVSFRVEFWRATSAPAEAGGDGGHADGV